MIMNRNGLNKQGFNLIEMMLAIVAFLLLLSMVLIFLNGQRTYRRDVTRMANMNQLEKALEVYVSETDIYPVGHTCINGKDGIIQELVDKKVFDAGVLLSL
jgi:prepilin-type N-terminal cleavage/methylation domain-containing protein